MGCRSMGSSTHRLTVRHTAATGAASAHTRTNNVVGGRVGGCRPTARKPWLPIPIRTREVMRRAFRRQCQPSKTRARQQHGVGIRMANCGSQSASHEGIQNTAHRPGRADGGGAGGGGGRPLDAVEGERRAGRGVKRPRTDGRGQKTVPPNSVDVPWGPNEGKKKTQSSEI